MLLELRERVGFSDDMRTSLDWFMARTLMWDATPVVVLHRVDEVVQSAVLLHIRCWHGIWTGVLKCGDLTGSGGVIAPAANQVESLERAARAVLDSGLAHTVVATIRLPAEGAPAADGGPAGMGRCGWQAREVHYHLDLAGGLEGFLMRQSRKFRRNFRYYRRRAEGELGCRFLPALTAAQSVAAVRALHGMEAYAVPARRALRHEAAIRDTPGGFAMGLVDGNGTWLSYLGGWRQGETVFIEWQLNRGGQEAYSLSTVMRSFFVEHEAERGMQSVVFVGGTSGAWARACGAEACSDLLATRSGPFGRRLAAFLARLRPNGQVGRLSRKVTFGRLNSV